MSRWMQRVGALFGGRVEPTTAPTRPPAANTVEPDADAAAAAAIPAADLRLPFFEWVIGAGPLLPTALRDDERRLLARLDKVLASEDSRAALLPRAAAVIPQLLNSLRDESQSTDALAQRVMRDPHLVAEVIRMANSAHARAAAPVVEIAEAIGRLGTDGLRRAIARVVVRPMFVGSADTLSARCGPRLWQHSDAQAAACQQEAGARGLDPFEGYLTGLMHNIGWTAALRVIDGREGGAPSGFSEAFAAAFEPRRETVFALIVMPWQLTPGLTALGADLLAHGLAGARTPLGAALRAAGERAALDMLGTGQPLASPGPARLH